MSADRPIARRDPVEPPCHDGLDPLSIIWGKEGTQRCFDDVGTGNPACWGSLVKYLQNFGIEPNGSFDMGAQ